MKSNFIKKSYLSLNKYDLIIPDKNDHASGYLKLFKNLVNWK